MNVIRVFLQKRGSETTLHENELANLTNSALNGLKSVALPIKELRLWANH